jgi:hypothetical protein
MTPKQKVLAKHPEDNCVADCSVDGGKAGIEFYDFAVWSDAAPHGYVLGDGETPRQAWKAAATNLSSGDNGGRNG